MTGHEGASYDDVPYPSYAFRAAQPDALALIARLFGVPVAHPSQGRVLELACASGGHLIPLAARHRQAEHVGIDLSPLQIKEAKRRSKALDLDNIRWLCADILDLPDDLGTFDTIIAHGVYSWVDTTVQHALLAACRRLLKPHGVAYVSYNTHPGWHLHGAVRQFMTWTAEHTPGTAIERVAAARARLEWLARAVPSAHGPYHHMLQRVVSSLASHNDAYVFHEFLETHNTPVFFTEFHDSARQAGLQYLGESSLGTMLDHYLPAETQETLRAMATNIIELEQYLDILRARTFRQTLLVQAEVGVKRDLTQVDLTGLYVCSPARCTSPPLAPDQPGAQTFVDPNTENPLTLADPGIRNILHLLIDSWPERQPLQEVIDQAWQRTYPNGVPWDEDGCQRARRQLELGVLSLHALRLIQLCVEDTVSVRDPGQHPEAWHVARYQALTSHRVTTPSHGTRDLPPLEHHLLAQLDGSRSRARVLTDLAAEDARQQRLTGVPSQLPTTAASLDSVLTQLAAWGLLVRSERDAPS